MTALETLIVNSLDIATSATELYSTTTCLNDADTEELITTIACSVSTALSHIQVPENLMFVRNAQSYVESMSDEELEEFSQMLNEQEFVFDETNVNKNIVEDAKVYTKQPPKRQ